MASQPNEDILDTYSNSLILTTSISKSLPALICIIFILLTCVPFNCHSIFNTSGIKKTIRCTVILYFTLYLIQALLMGFDSFADNYTLWKFDDKWDIGIDLTLIIVHIIGHITFYLYLMERLHILFGGTMYAVRRSTFISLIIIGFNVEIYHLSMHIVFEFDLFEQFDSKYKIHLIIMLLFLIISTLYAWYLIYMFIHNLFLIIISQRKSISMTTLMHSDTIDISIIREDEFDFDYKQINIIQTITKNCVLIIAAIIARNCAIVSLTLILHHDEGVLSWNQVIVIIIYNLALIFELLAIYLTFSFTKHLYKCCCGKIHKMCYLLCQSLAKSKAMKADRKKAKIYVAMTDC